MSETELFDFEEEEEEEYTGFKVEDDKAAEWCMEKIRQAEADTAMWDAHFEAQKRRVHETNDHTIEVMKGFLRDYFAKVPHKITKTEENYRLPSGKLVLKKQKPQMDRDEDALLEWVRQNHPEYIKRKEMVDWEAFKKTLKISGECAVDEEGEIVEAITVVPRPDVFTIGK
jgi:hypothetical protein